MDDEFILQKLKETIGFGKEVNSTIDIQYKQRSKFQKIAENILRVRFGESSIYYSDFMKTYLRNPLFKEDHNVLIEIQIGILESICYAIENKLTEDLFYQRELLVFSNMLDQAFEFLEYNLNHAAGIYGRIVLETTIKEFAISKGLESESNIKFDRLIIELRKNNFIQKPFENSLRANYEIGSWAAHGNEEFSKLTKNEIKEFLIFIRDRVLTLT